MLEDNFQFLTHIIEPALDDEGKPLMAEDKKTRLNTYGVRLIFNLTRFNQSLACQNADSLSFFAMAM